jgi:hypothetical protein
MGALTSVLLPWREEEVQEGDNPLPHLGEGRGEGENGQFLLLVMPPVVTIPVTSSAGVRSKAG